LPSHRNGPVRGRGVQLPLVLAGLLSLPGSLLGAAGLLQLASPHLDPAVAALVYGVAVVGAAFMLAWAAEAVQVDISSSVALGILALMTVLPEYAVDFVFAWRGGGDVQQFGPACQAPGAEGASSCSLALATMTGANRLLIGVGWALVVFVAWIQWRRRGEPDRGMTMARSRSVELAYLALACAYSLTLPLKSTITLFDAIILIGIFVAYTLRISKAPQVDPELIGPAAWIGGLPKRARRATVLGLFVVAGAVILLVAEHFAQSLVDTGREFGVSEFLLVQWLAPIAAEAPELLVVGLYAWRLKTDEALTTLVSSKVNKWTLLVGSLPVVFAISSGSLHGLPIQAGQREEVLLTAAQTVFAVAILVNLSLSIGEAAALFGLFSAQFIVGAMIPAQWHGAELIIISAVYMVFGLWLILHRLGDFRDRLRDGFRTPFELMKPSTEPDHQSTRDR
jgi:cation:H+ antiporter